MTTSLIVSPYVSCRARLLYCLCATLLAAVPVLAQTRLYPPLPNWQSPRDGVKLAERGRRGMVTAADETAARAGLEILKSGGNAIDAAIAVGFALAVTMPEAGNLGGGGLMLVYRADGRSDAFDYREMLPAAAKPEQYTNPLNRYFGARSVGVPGTVAAFGTAHSRYGRKSWREVLDPARRLAKDGMPLSRRMEETIAYAAVRMRDYPEAARLFLRSDGTPLREGDRFVQPELAETIAKLQQLGWREFYHGEMATRMVNDLRQRGSLVTQQDWESYEVQVLPPLRGSYRGFPILTMPPASSGGVALLEMLNILEQFRLGGEAAGSGDSWHVIIEAMKRADFDRRRWYRDRGLRAVGPEAILTKEYAKAISSRIHLDRTVPSDRLDEGAAKPEQTTHFNVVDADGNVASNTYTTQGALGSLVMPGNTGVLLSGAASYFDTGLGNANDIGPRKRAIFSMSPTLVLRPDGKPWLALGLSGGARIPNVLLQLIVNIVDWGVGLRDAVDGPRIHQSYQPDEVLAERGAFSPEILKDLKSRGHRITSRGLPLGEANAILIDEAGWRFGWADGRLGGGRALGY